MAQCSRAPLLGDPFIVPSPNSFHRRFRVKKGNNTPTPMSTPAPAPLLTPPSTIVRTRIKVETQKPVTKLAFNTPKRVSASTTSAASGAKRWQISGSSSNSSSRTRPTCTRSSLLAPAVQRRTSQSSGADMREQGVEQVRGESHMQSKLSSSEEQEKERRVSRSVTRFTDPLPSPVRTPLCRLGVLEFVTASPVVPVRARQLEVSAVEVVKGEAEEEEMKGEKREKEVEVEVEVEVEGKSDSRGTRRMGWKTSRIPIGTWRSRADHTQTSISDKARRCPTCGVVSIWQTDTDTDTDTDRDVNQQLPSSLEEDRARPLPVISAHSLAVLLPSIKPIPSESTLTSESEPRLPFTPSSPSPSPACIQPETPTVVPSTRSSFFSNWFSKRSHPPSTPSPLSLSLPLPLPLPLTPPSTPSTSSPSPRSDHDISLVQFAVLDQLRAFHKQGKRLNTFSDLTYQRACTVDNTLDALSVTPEAASALEEANVLDVLFEGASFGSDRGSQIGVVEDAGVANHDSRDEETTCPASETSASLPTARNDYNPGDEDSETSIGLDFLEKDIHGSEACTSPTPQLNAPTLAVQVPDVDVDSESVVSTEHADADNSAKKDVNGLHISISDDKSEQTPLPLKSIQVVAVEGTGFSIPETVEKKVEQVRSELQAYGTHLTNQICDNRRVPLPVHGDHDEGRGTLPSVTENAYEHVKAVTQDGKGLVNTSTVLVKDDSPSLSSEHNEPHPLTPIQSRIQALYSPPSQLQPSSSSSASTNSQLPPPFLASTIQRDSETTQSTTSTKKKLWNVWVPELDAGRRASRDERIQREVEGLRCMKRVGGVSGVKGPSGGGHSAEADLVGAAMGAMMHASVGVGVVSDADGKEEGKGKTLSLRAMAVLERYKRGGGTRGSLPSSNTNC